eukprot:UN02447
MLILVIYCSISIYIISSKLSSSLYCRYLLTQYEEAPQKVTQKNNYIYDTNEACYEWVTLLALNNTNTYASTINIYNFTTMNVRDFASPHQFKPLLNEFIGIKSTCWQRQQNAPPIQFTQIVIESTEASKQFHNKRFIDHPYPSHPNLTQIKPNPSPLTTAIPSSLRMTSESLEIIKWRKIALRKSAVSNHTTLFPPTMHGVLCPHITTQSTFTNKYNCCI